MTTAIARIAPEDVVAMDTEGFFALRRDCLTSTEVERLACAASNAWLESASEADQECDPDGYGVYEKVWERYAASADSTLYALPKDLLQLAQEDSSLYGCWGVSVGRGMAAMHPQYVTDLDGDDLYLAPAYPGAYKSLNPSTY